MNLILPLPRNLYLVKQVDQDSINAITKDIININENDEVIRKVYEAYGLEYKPKPISLYIDSYGGAVYQCMGLVSVIENSKIDVHTIVTGCAMSAGFLLLITGKKRFAYPKSTILYHQLRSGVDGNLKAMKEYINQLDILDKKLEDHVISKTAMSKRMLRDLNTKKIDFYMTAKEAQKLKVIDEIL